MKFFTRNFPALLILAVLAVVTSAPAQARSGHHGWHGHHARGHHHSYRHRHHSRRHHVGHRGRAAAGGNASWYGSEHAGRRTANGERFNPNGLTAAHRSLPFGTRVRVTNRVTGRSVVVRINDRGPFVGGRQIDLARGAARAIGMGGTSYVSMAVVR